MQFWLDVEDASGNKLGRITTALELQTDTVIDGVGGFAFAMPAADPDSALLVAKRHVRFWGIDDAGPRDLGVGIIEQIVLSEQPDAQATYRVMGAGQLKELAYRNVGNLKLYERKRDHAARVSFWYTHPSPAWVDLTNTTDYALDDATTNNVIADDSGTKGWDPTTELLLVAFGREFDQVNFTVASVNNVSATTKVQFYRPETHAWEYCSVLEDTTIVDGKPFAQSGYIKFETPDGWGLEDSYAVPGPNYDIRFQIEAAGELTSTLAFSDISVSYSAPTNKALEIIMSHAPTDWALDAGGYLQIQAPRTTQDYTKLLLNTDFEYAGDWDHYWVASGTDGDDLIADGGAGHTGDHCLKITRVGADPYLYQDTACDANADYRMSFYTKGDAGAGQITWRLYDIRKEQYLTFPIYTNKTAATWDQYVYDFTIPPECSTVRVEFHSTVGSAYVDDVVFVLRSGGEVYMQNPDETAISVLSSLAEQTGEHFIQSYSGKRVLWLGYDERPSGIRALLISDTAGIESTLDLALIVELRATTAGADLVSRVIPRGGDNGSRRQTLAETTRIAPAGYVLNVSDGYLERTAATTAYGVRIDKVLDMSDVNAKDTSLTQRTYAANMLFDRALQYLENHSATDMDVDVPIDYEITLAHCQQVLYPGHTIYVVAKRVVDGYTAYNIDKHLWINSVSQRIDRTGRYLVDINAATHKRLNRNDVSLLITELRKVRIARTQNTAQDGW